MMNQGPLNEFNPLLPGFGSAFRQARSRLLSKAEIKPFDTVRLLNGKRATVVSVKADPDGPASYVVRLPYGRKATVGLDEIAYEVRSGLTGLLQKAVEFLDRKLF